MGLIDATQAKWDLRPTPTRASPKWWTSSGGLQPGPEVKVDVLPEGTETLALAEDSGRSIRDLPRF